MSEIWIKEFTGGLDSRRMPEATEGGVLLVAKDCHINRGGEVEKRAAFVPTYTLPAGTTGLAAGLTGLIVFGSAAPPPMPTGVQYQRLQHSDGVTALTRVLSYDLYAGKVYAVGEFADGIRFHFYDGVRVADWFDGRARASFNVVYGSTSNSAAARGTLQVTGGSVGASNVINNIKVNGVTVTGGTIAHTGNNATTASAIATSINNFTSSPDYTAIASGNAVTVYAATNGTTPNGFPIALSVGGDVVVSGDVSMHDGADPTQSALNNLTVDGIAIIGAPVLWSSNANAFASAVAAAVNAYTSAPDYTATAVGPIVNVIATGTAAADNGKAVAFTVAGGLQLSPASGLVLAGGVDAGSTYTPGTFVKTIGSKVYSVSGPNTHFSGVQKPTKWTTEAAGAGFIDMSTQASGSEMLTALARYNKYVAIFAGKVVQIWYMDPDPTKNEISQVLNNTGTFSPRSVTQFGDNDLFYLDDSGVRSLRARDASNAAATADVGVPIDTLIIDKIKTLSSDDRLNVFGVIEPAEGRFWLSIIDTIFVFSFFPGASISAWSTYMPGFPVDAMVVLRQRVYLRSGDTIYVYGGLGADPAFDATVAEVWLPFLSAGTPTRKKKFQGIDAALKGLWNFALATDPTLPANEEVIATLAKTTFMDQQISGSAESTHFSPRFRSRGTGPARLASVVVHFTSNDPDDK